MNALHVPGVSGQFQIFGNKIYFKKMLHLHFRMQLKKFDLP